MAGTESTMLEARVSALEDSLDALTREVERMREDMRALAGVVGPLGGSGSEEGG
jgi:hypothetical protein